MCVLGGGVVSYSPFLQSEHRFDELDGRVGGGDGKGGRGSSGFYTDAVTTGPLAPRGCEASCNMKLLLVMNYLCFLRVSMATTKAAI